MSSIFISYRREDSAGYAGRLHESLERRFGKGQVFRDVDTLEPGQDFVDAIAARLRDCSACLVVIGREWLDARDASGVRRLDQETDYVRLEIAAALSRPDVLVIPVLVEGMTMPPEMQLPDAIRGLARRHAASLRDEAWDVDVDRLARTLQKSVGTAVRGTVPLSGAKISRAAAAGWNPKWAAVALAAVVALLLLRVFLTGDDETDTSGTTATVATTNGSSAANPAAAQAIPIPRVAEVARGHLIYTLLSGGVVSTGDMKTVHLRFRLSNEGPYSANFWDGSFRLMVAGQVLAPTSGLNEVVPGHAVQQGIVSFEVPPGVTEGVLQVRDGTRPADVPLSLTPTGEPSTVNTADTSDVLSRSIVVELVRDARLIVSGKEISYTLLSATARRFANTLRISASVQMSNSGRYDAHFNTGTFRLLADGQATAPFDGPNEVVKPGTMATADLLFDVAPSAARVILRVMGESVAEVPLELPETVRR